MKYLPFIALPLALAACSSPPAEPAETTTTTTETTAPATPAADTAAAPAAAGTPLADAAPPAAKICLTCHKADKDAGNAIGPNLFGMFGKKSGGVEGYNYTAANKNSGHTWDEPTLDKYLTNPMKDIPGTKMTWAGYADAAKRKEVIEWMKTLK